MKKIFSILVPVTALALITVLLSACNQKAPETEAAPETTEAAEAAATEIGGGWTGNSTFENPSIPEDAKEAFELAAEGITGAAYEPVAFLGTQVVAGTNYAFLCKVTPVVPNAQSALKVVTVYKDLEGKATFKDTIDFDITKYTEKSDVAFDELVGGYYCGEASGTALTDKAAEAFDKAIKGLSGVGYEPLALLGTQVVAGTNYAVLCKAATISPDQQFGLAVVIVYEDLSSEATVNSICNFSIAD